MVSRFAAHPRWSEFLKHLGKLVAMSQTSAAVLGRTTPSSDEDIGGKRPSGGLDRKGDREPDYRQHTFDYFTRKLERCHSDDRFAKLVDEAAQAVRDWQITPRLDDRPTSMADPQWKRWVAETNATVAQIVSWYSVSRQRVHQIRNAYRDTA